MQLVWIVTVSVRVKDLLQAVGVDRTDVSAARVTRCDRLKRLRDQVLGVRITRLDRPYDLLVGIHDCCGDREILELMVCRSAPFIIRVVESLNAFIVLC